MASSVVSRETWLCMEPAEHAGDQSGAIRQSAYSCGPHVSAWVRIDLDWLCCPTSPPPRDAVSEAAPAASAGV